MKHACSRVVVAVVVIAVVHFQHVPCFESEFDSIYSPPQKRVTEARQNFVT